MCYALVREGVNVVIVARNPETLANLKSPRQYISQTNVATAFQLNLEKDGHHVDSSATGSNAASDSAVEALGAIHRSKDARGEGNLQQERDETRGVFGR
jgi:hypothetical protein